MGLLKAVGSLLGGDTIKDVGNIIDNLHTSDEEKAEARQKIEQLLVDAEQKHKFKYQLIGKQI